MSDDLAKNDAVVVDERTTRTTANAPSPPLMTGTRTSNLPRSSGTGGVGNSTGGPRRKSRVPGVRDSALPGCTSPTSIVVSSSTRTTVIASGIPSATSSSISKTKDATFVDKSDHSPPDDNPASSTPTPRPERTAVIKPGPPPSSTSAVSSPPVIPALTNSNNCSPDRQASNSTAKPANPSTSRHVEEKERGGVSHQVATPLSSSASPPSLLRPDEDKTARSPATAELDNGSTACDDDGGDARALLVERLESKFVQPQEAGTKDKSLTAKNETLIDQNKQIIELMKDNKKLISELESSFGEKIRQLETAVQKIDTQLGRSSINQSEKDVKLDELSNKIDGLVKLVTDLGAQVANVSSGSSSSQHQTNGLEGDKTYVSIGDQIHHSGPDGKCCVIC